MEKYDKIKNLFKQGLNQTKIAEIMGYSGSQSVKHYLERYSELKQIYETNRSRK